MSELEQQCLDAFPTWLEALASDAQELADAVGNEQTPEDVRRFAVASLNYIFRSLDLIPDGIEDLGYLDDAFVLRVAAARAREASRDGQGVSPTISRLADDAQLISELLGEDYVRLERFVDGLQKGASRGRTVDDIVGDATIRGDFLNEVNGWVTSYEAPAFHRDEKNLVKLRSFMRAKLP